MSDNMDLSPEEMDRFITENRKIDGVLPFGIPPEKEDSKDTCVNLDGVIEDVTDIRNSVTVYTEHFYKAVHVGDFMGAEHFLELLAPHIHNLNRLKQLLEKKTEHGRVL